jgi:hypothetical protein
MELMVYLKCITDKRISMCNMLYIVYVLSGISPASNYVLPTFRNPLSGPSAKAGCGIFHININII